MFGLDDQVADLAAGSGLWLVLLVGVLLGLRHATDPDHLTAVSTLLLSDERHGARRATRLGLMWGLGHGTTLLVFGLPIVLFEDYLPETAQRAAEAAVGVMIVALAVRLLVRWRRGYLHAHAHAHDGVRHAHPHVHEHAPEHDGQDDPPAHEHRHAEGLGRSPRMAYGIGLVHGLGGSAGVGILLIGAVAGSAMAVVSLLLFCAASALSMAAVSAAFGHAVSRDGAVRRLESVTPAFATLGVLFGTWYVLGAVGTVPYVL